VYAAPWVTHIEYRWELPEYASYLRGIASFSRLVMFDRRGLGMSDPVSPDALPDLETRMTDIGAVMDEVGSERAVIYGASESGSLAVMFAASHPERTLALVLHGSFPSGKWDPEAPWGYTEEDWAERLAMLERAWGTEEFVRWQFPTFTDERVIRWFASYLRRGASPGAVIAWERMDYETDVRDVLSSVHVPTLVLHREEDAPEANRYLAEHIAGARYVALPGKEHVPYIGDQDSVLREIDSFVRSIVDAEAELDRVLATVLFTDIVDSTAQAATMGDVRWREVRGRHDELVRAQLARFRGREIKTMGDGFLATFDGPARGVRCAHAIVEAVKTLGIEVRTGVHTGEVATEGNDVTGLGVAIGARVGALAGASEVLVSQTVKDLVAGSGLAFEEAGEHELKGVPDRWRLYRVVT
jgi:class 3 adenylate cyclase